MSEVFSHRWCITIIWFAFQANANININRSTNINRRVQGFPYFRDEPKICSSPTPGKIPIPSPSRPPLP